MARSKLFLASTPTADLGAWLDDQVERPQRALFVPTAANPLKQRDFVELTRQTLRDAGVTVTTFDLAEASTAATGQAVEQADLVVVGGGFAIYLLEHARRTRFDRLVTSRVTSGQLSYAGFSAGAALAGPDLSAFHSDDDGDDSDSDSDSDPGRVDSFAGLGLVPFVVLPHRNRGQADRHDALGDSGTGGPFLSLNDDQAVRVNGTTFRLTTVPIS